jgi:hypothetical protein
MTWRPWSPGGQEPLVLGGDFNVWGQGDAYAPYREVLDQDQLPVFGP